MVLCVSYISSMRDERCKVLNDRRVKYIDALVKKQVPAGCIWKADDLLSMSLHSDLESVKLCGDREGAKFHLNQALIIHLISLVGFLPYIRMFVMPLATILWVIGFIYATREEETEVPVVGSLRLLK